MESELEEAASRGQLVASNAAGSLKDRGQEESI